MFDFIRYVKSVFMIHVGGTRCVTSSTDNIMKIHARITLTVEFIRTCIFLFLFDVSIQVRVWSILTLFSDFIGFQGHASSRCTSRDVGFDVLGWKPSGNTQYQYVKLVFVIHVGGTRYVTSSTDNNMNIRARITLTVECIRTCICIFLLYVEIQGRV